MSLGEIIMNNYCLQPDSLNLLFSINYGTVTNGIKDLGIIADITISTNISQRKSKYKRRRKEYKHQEEDTVLVRKAACIYILYTSSNTERLPHLATILSVSFAFTTQLGWEYYSERCLEYLSGGRMKYVKVYRWI